ncbi:acyltransferase [Bradyrhizobium jicamae]|nr:acyltransferase [Bradyrhizobium jicamae]
MRGIAILMVIGIHALPQPLDAAWSKSIDAALRPCVPIFLFASGYLTAKAGRVPLAKRLTAALIPYTIAFAAAYVYMAAHNPAMDHRLIATLARFGLAYVFVYYYVFVYLGCTIVLWLIFSGQRPDAEGQDQRLTLLLILAIGFGLATGAYLDPAMARLGFSDPLIEETRMRDIPFWFSFVALGALTAMYRPSIDRRTVTLLVGATAVAFLLYATVRVLGIGDAAAYDSVAYFLYAGLLCLLLWSSQARLPAMAAIGSGSYFIYLWHIFIVMALRDHAALRQYGPVASFVVTCSVTATLSIGALWCLRRCAPARLARWLGA